MSALKTGVFADDDNQPIPDDDFGFAQHVAMPAAVIDQPAAFAPPRNPGLKWAAADISQR